MARHEECAETQCHLGVHCVVCSQPWPCDASRLAAVVAEIHKHHGDAIATVCPYGWLNLRKAAGVSA